MTIKKTLLLVSAVAALVAFAAPSAQADEWYTGETKLGSTTATGDQVLLAGESSTTAGPGFAFRSGPCPTTSELTLWNASGQAAGEVNDLQISEPCETNIPGCTVENAEASAGFPWVIIIVSGLIAYQLSGFTKRYNDGCTSLGIPPGVPLGGSGTLTGTFNSTTHCFDFNGAGDLKGGLGEIRTDGSICNEDASKTLTLK